jgi:hypothetical protein
MRPLSSQTNDLEKLHSCLIPFALITTRHLLAVLALIRTYHYVHFTEKVMSNDLYPHLYGTFEQFAAHSFRLDQYFL